MHRVHIAAHAGPQLDGIDGLQAAGEFVGIVHRAHQHLGDGHGRGRRRGLCVGVGAMTQQGPAAAHHGQGE